MQRYFCKDELGRVLILHGGGLVDPLLRSPSGYTEQIPNLEAEYFETSQQPRCDPYGAAQLRRSPGRSNRASSASLTSATPTSTLVSIYLIKESAAHNDN